MTFHKNQMPQKGTLKSRDQRGVTLLLAILVMAALSAIVFSIAAIVYNEVRTSADLTKTEPIITGDQALAEDALFKITRGISSLPGCTSPTTTTVNGVVVSTCASYYSSNPMVLNLGQSSRKDFYIYNPADQSQSPGYTNITVQINGGFQGTVYFCNWNDSDCVASSTPIDVRTISASGPTTTWTSPSLNPSSQYLLSIVNSATASGVYTVSSAPIGLPAGTTTIEATGTRQGLTRKLEVNVPQ